MRDSLFVAKNLVGYTVLQLVFNTPLSFFLGWLFAQLIPYVPPMKEENSFLKKDHLGCEGS